MSARLDLRLVGHWPVARLLLIYKIFYFRKAESIACPYPTIIASSKRGDQSNKAASMWLHGQGRRLTTR